MEFAGDRSPSAQGLSFRRGIPGVFDGDGPDASFTPKSGLTRKGKRVAKGKSGTRIRFWPDRQIFTRDAAYVYDDLITRARQPSFLVPGLELVIRDQRGRSEEHTSELQSLMRSSYAVFCLQKQRLNNKSNKYHEAKNSSHNHTTS